MNREDAELFIEFIKHKKIATVIETAEHLNISKRRLHDVLPILDVLGLVDRSKRGSITWVGPVDNNTYDCNKLIIKSVGAITLVKNLGMQVMIEQTVNGFTVEKVT